MCLLKTSNLTVKCKNRQAHELTSSYLIDQISISIESNKITSLTGPSGSGKSIFAKSISALLPTDNTIIEGKLFFDGQYVSYDDLKKLRGKNILYTPQNASASLNPVIKIKKQLHEAARMSSSELNEILNELNFKSNDITRLLNSYPFQLSGGENQRCLLAAAIAIKPRLLILDEPTSALDSRTEHHFSQLIKKVKDGYHLTILLISHNLSFMENISDSIYTIKKGRIIDKKVL